MEGKGVLVSGEWRHMVHQTEQDTKEAPSACRLPPLLLLQPGWAEAQQASSSKLEPLPALQSHGVEGHQRQQAYGSK